MKLSIVKRYKIFFAITITFLIIGIGSMLFKGFNLALTLPVAVSWIWNSKILLPFLRYVRCLKKKDLGQCYYPAGKQRQQCQKALRAC